MKKNFKRFVSIMLVACMSLSMAAGASGELSEKASPSRFAITSSGETVEMNAGVAAYFEKRDRELREQGYIVGTHEIVNTDITPQSGSSVTEIDVAAYNGYKMKLQTVKTPLFRDWRRIDNQQDTVTKLLSKGYDLLVGRHTTVLHVNLGAMFNPFVQTGVQENTMSMSTDDVLTTQFILIEDRDNKYAEAYYPQSSAESKLVRTNFAFKQFRAGSNIPVAYDSAQSTFDSSRYLDYTWMRKMAYDNYISPFENLEATNYIY